MVDASAGEVEAASGTLLVKRPVDDFPAVFDADDLVGLAVLVGARRENGRSLTVTVEQRAERGALEVREKLSAQTLTSTLDRGAGKEKQAQGERLAGPEPAISERLGRLRGDEVVLRLSGVEYDLAGLCWGDGGQGAILGGGAGGTLTGVPPTGFGCGALTPIVPLNLRRCLDRHLWHRRGRHDDHLHAHASLYAPCHAVLNIDDLVLILLVLHLKVPQRVDDSIYRSLVLLVKSPA